MSSSSGEGELLLTEADVRRLVRLLSEALTPEDGREAKCRRLMDGLCEIIDADAWMWLRSRVEGPTKPPISIDVIFSDSLSDDLVGAYVERSLEVDGTPPEYAPMHKLLAKGRHFTVARPELVPDAVWRTGHNAVYTRRFGYDEMLYSWVPLRETNGGVLLSGCHVLRRPGKPPFSPRDCRLVHLTFQELGPLHVLGLNADLADDLVGLTPRQRSVLAFLVNGKRTREIAEQLTLSPHTINDYIKAIYRHFKVSSRAELVRKFMMLPRADRAAAAGSEKSQDPQF